MWRAGWVVLRAVCHRAWPQQALGRPVYIEIVPPKLMRFDIISHLGPVMGPEIAKTMESYEETLKRM